MPRPSRRVRRLILVGFGTALLVGAVVALDAWRHPRLPHLLLVEPTDAVWEEFGLDEWRFDSGNGIHRGPVVATVGANVGELGIGAIAPGNTFWIIGGGAPGISKTNPGSISEMKRAMRETFGRTSSIRGTVRVVYFFRKTDGSVWSNTQHLRLSRWQRFLYLFGY